MLGDEVSSRGPETCQVEDGFLRKVMGRLSSNCRCFNSRDVFGFIPAESAHNNPASVGNLLHFKANSVIFSQNRQFYDIYLNVWMSFSDYFHVLLLQSSNPDNFCSSQLGTKSSCSRIARYPV